MEHDGRGHEPTAPDVLDVPEGQRVGGALQEPDAPSREPDERPPSELPTGQQPQRGRLRGKRPRGKQPKGAQPPQAQQPPDAQPPNKQPPNKQPKGAQPPQAQQPPDAQPANKQPPDKQPKGAQPPQAQQPPDAQPPDTQPPNKQPPNKQPTRAQPMDAQPTGAQPPDTQPPIQLEQLDPGQPGFNARLLRYASELKSFSRRTFLIGAGASSALAADMIFTRHVQSERRSTKILAVGDDFADAYYPDSSWILFPGYKTSWEEAQWILNSLRGALNQRGQLAAVGYSNLGLDIDEVTAAVVLHIREKKLKRLFFYGHSFGGMVATQVTARLRELHGVEVELIVLDSSPFSRGDVLDQSWFEGVVFLYESGFRIPTVLRGGYEFGERVVHKNERTWRQVWDQTLEQLSPIAPSSELVQSESAYIYHFIAERFVGQLGQARMAYIGNPRDDTVNYETARESWTRTFKDNMVSSDLRTEGARPPHASPQWNPFVYKPIVTWLQDEFFALPVGGQRALVY